MVDTAPTRSYEHSADHPEGAGPAGTATLVELVGRSEPSRSKPSGTTVFTGDGVRVVALEFLTGDGLDEHAAPHPVLIQVVRGRVDFTVSGEMLDLGPGRVLHLTRGLPHAVRAVEPSTLTVTMLPTQDGTEEQS